MSFDALPNELFSPILKYANFPLQKRIQLRAVSPRWQVVIEDGLKKETDIVIRDHLGDSKKRNDLVVMDAMHFNSELGELLGRIFPAVAQLTVDISRTQFIRQLPEVLSPFPSTLTSLTLLGKYDYYQDTGKQKPFSERHNDLFTPSRTSNGIANAINSLTSLTRLQLNASALNHRLCHSLAPTFARLEQLYFNDKNEPSACSDDFPKHKDIVHAILNSLTDRCTHLQIREHGVDWRGVKIGSSLTNLELIRFLDINGFNLLCIIAECRLLRVLTLHFEPSLYCELNSTIFQVFSRAFHLTDLELHYVSYSPSEVLPPQGNETFVTNVRRLVIYEMYFEVPFSGQFDGQRVCKTLAAWFPSLEHLTIQCNRRFHEQILLYKHLISETATINLEALDEMIANIE